MTMMMEITVESTGLSMNVLNIVYRSKRLLK